MNDPLPAPTVRSWRPRIALAAIVAINLAGIGAIITRASDAEWVAAVGGILIAQVLLLAIWCGLGNAPALIRVAVSLLMLAAFMAVYGYSVGRQLDDYLGKHEAGWAAIIWQYLAITSIALLLQWLAVSIPLFALRLLRRLRIQRIDGATVASGADSQFNLRQLLIATAIAAVLFAVGRLLMRSEVFEGVAFDRDSAWNLVLATIGNLLLGVLAPRFALAPRLFALWFLVGCLYTAAIAGIVYAVGKTAFSMRQGEDLLWLYYGAQHGWMMANLLLARIAGYRLIRRERSPKAAV